MKTTQRACPRGYTDANDSSGIFPFKCSFGIFLYGLSHENAGEEGESEAMRNVKDKLSALSIIYIFDSELD